MAAVINMPPRTYQEWLDCFSRMREKPISDEYIDVLSRGTLQCSGYMSQRFQLQIISLINDMLDARTKRFVRELNKMLELNELADMVPLFRKFRSDIMQCLFFNKLECVSPQFRQELLESVDRQTTGFLKKIISHLYEQALETGNTDIEDVLFQIKRIKFFIH